MNRPHGYAFLALVAAAVLSAGGCSSRMAGPFDPSAWHQEPAASGESLHVGTVKRTEFLVAYYGSAERAEYINGLRAQRDQARAAGDHARAEALEREGAASQEVAHQRLMGKATLAPIIDSIRARLPAIARAAGVSQIVEEGSPVPEGATTVDVTAAVTALFPPARTGAR